MTTEEAAKAVVERIIAAIESDLSVHRGQRLSDLDKETWRGLIAPELTALSASPWVSCKVPPTPDDGERVIVRFDSGLVDVWHTKRWDWQGLIRLGLKEWMRVPD